MREYHAGHDQDEGDVERCLHCDVELDDSNSKDSGWCADCFDEDFASRCENADYTESLMV